MHTGRNDAELRARTRIPVRVASDASDGSAGFDVRPEFERFSQADDVFSRSRTDSELRVPRGDERPILMIEGQARDGVQSPTAQFQQLLADLEEAMPYVALNPSIDRNKFTIHMTSFADAPDETGEEDDGPE